MKLIILKKNISFFTCSVSQIKLLLLSISMFCFIKGQSQTLIIDPASVTGGSFENTTTTFTANGWKVANDATNKWFVGTASFCNGTKGAYIGTAVGNNTYTITASSVSHLYRTVTFPAGEDCITFSFNWKSDGESAYDGFKIYFGSVGGPAPVAGSDFLLVTDPSAEQIGDPMYDVSPSCGTVSLTIPPGYAGTTRRLVFSWENDASDGNTIGATLDNISLVSSPYTVPNCATNFIPVDMQTGVSKCNPILNWDAPVSTSCNQPVKYYIYFGTSSNPPLIDSTVSLFYNLSILSDNTTYYWKIVPINTSGLAVGCLENRFTTNASLCAISPGGVGTANITAWFKADVLTPGNLTSWTTFFPAGAVTVTDPGAPYAQVTNSNLAGSNSFNYNQYISFAGNNVTAGNERFLYTTSSFNLMTNSNNPADQSSFFTTYETNPSNINDAIVYWQPATGSYGLQCRGFARMAIGKGIGLSLLSSRDITPTATASVFSYTGNRSTSTSMNAYYNGTTMAAVTPSESQGVTGMSIGAHLATSGPTFIEPFQGGQVEHVFFNSTLNSLEVNRVHTYMAVKYGVTLNTDYTASNNTIIFTNAAPFNNNIIGLGRDDASGLVQKQSHNPDDSVRFYTSTLAATNAANATTFASDNSFLMTGATTGALRSTPAANAVKPPGIFSRLEREWKITKTNFGETFSMDIKLSLGAAVVAPLDLRLLVDNTGNFANALVFAAGGGLTFSFNYPIITVSGISAAQIPDNSTWNITIGSVSGASPLPVELVSFTGKCESKKNILNWATASENGANSFLIEKSVDAVKYITIGKVTANGNSNKLLNYSYADNNATQGTYYYRLKEIDVNGNYKYSVSVKVKSNCEFTNNEIENLIVFPNPVKNNLLQFSYTTYKKQTAIIKLCNITGKVCIKKSLQLTEGINNAKLNIESIPPGIYFLRIELQQQKNKVIKVIINK